MSISIVIYDVDTDEEVHRIETDKTGRTLDKVLDGLDQKMDGERFFYMVEETTK